jgi:hypothetical protein
MVKIVESKINGIDITIEEPSKDESSWTVIEAQSFKIDKGDFILKEFKKDFPNLKIRDADHLVRVVSRSEVLNEWYAKTSLLYADSVQLPLAYKDQLSPIEYKEFFSDTSLYKKNLALETDEIQQLSKTFKEEAQIIRDKYKKLNDDIISKNKMYPILVLNKNQLPISASIMIEDYTPKTGDITMKRNAYGREVLISYQKSLIQAVKNKPDIDILAVIKEMSTK